MNGRLESELNKQKVIKAKLAKLPPIFTEFYSYMEEDDRSYNTIEHYIDYNIEFMEYITKGNKDDEYYKNVTQSNVRQFISSQRTKEKDGEIVRTGDSIIATKWSAIKKFFICNVFSHITNCFIIQIRFISIQNQTIDFLINIKIP